MSCDPAGRWRWSSIWRARPPGKKTLIVFVNDEEAARDTVTLRVEEDEE